MGFCGQLRLLLWKNYKLRKRQKLRLVAEIVWPLFLFLILAWVRTRGLKLYVHECHFDEKALPSAGIVPFLQTFFCTWNNTCHETANEHLLSTVPKFNRSMLSILMNDVQDILTSHISAEQIESIGRLREDVDVIQSMAKKWQDPRTRAQGVVELASLFPDASKMKQEIMAMNISVSPQMVDVMLDSMVNVTGLQQLILNRKQLASLILRNGSDVDSMGNDIEDMSSSQMRLLPNLHRVACDEKVFSAILSNQKNPAGLDLLRHQLCALARPELERLVAELLKHADKDVFLQQLSTIAEENMGDSLDLEAWRKMMDVSSDVMNDIKSLQSFQQLRLDVSQLNARYEALVSSDDEEAVRNPLPQNKLDARTLNLIGMVMCGRNMSDPTNLFMDMEGRSKLFNYQVNLRQHTNETFKYEPDETTTPRCNEFFERLESRDYTKLVWRQIKPFIRGKILYAPKTNATERVMERVNDTFGVASDLLVLCEIWLNHTSPMIRKILANSSDTLIPGIQRLLRASTGPRAILAQTFISTAAQNLRISEKRVIDTIKQASEYLQVKPQEEWIETIESFDKIVSAFSMYMECYEVNRVEAFATEEEAVERGGNLTATNTFWAAIIFTNLEDASANKNNSLLNDTDLDKKTLDILLNELPPYVKYKIRMDSDRIDGSLAIKDRKATVGPRRRPIIDLKYITYGFSYLQDLIEHSIIREQTNVSVLPGIWLQQFPYPCYMEDQFIRAIARTFPMFMVLAWVYTAAMIIKSIVYEKEKRLKETMKMMGMSTSVHWISWFITSLLMMFITICILSFVIVYGNILENSNILVIIVFMTIYAIATICLCFLISVFFNQANISAAAGGMIFFSLYLPYPFMEMWDEKLAVWHRLLGMIFSNVTFGYGCNYLAYLEKVGDGAQWDQLFVTGNPQDPFGLGWVCIFLLVDAAIYMLIALYIEAVFPGQYGVPRKWYFPVQKSFWCPDSAKSKKEMKVAKQVAANINAHPSDFEEEPTHLPLGVSVKHLTKVYPNKKVAVQDLSINFFENQITSFLGHNGAGKTTTISIITGLFPPTTGTVEVYQKDIRTSVDTVRKDLGLCPQHNILFNHLTVEEHLWFYAKLKNKITKKALIKEEINQMICDLGLPHKRNALSSTLSGGMQRKLSVAIAFIGGSRAVILDEPTAGVDPYARRSIWDLLIKYKKNRTIILTTHHMDEADLLGDRIAIISRGMLKCCGSSLFLKSAYGSGYYITLVKVQPSIGSSPRLDKKIKRKTWPPNNDSESQDEGVADLADIVNESNTTIASAKASWASESQITSFIRRHIPATKLIENIGSELTFTVPHDSPQALQSLLTDLDENLPALGIASYGMSDTTLEEVFLRVAEDESDTEQKKKKRKGSKTESFKLSTERIVSAATSPVRRLKGHLLLENNTDDSDKGNAVTNSEASQNTDTTAYNIPALPKFNEVSPIHDVAKVTGCCLFIKQFHALLMKRFHRTRRNIKGLLSEIVLPALFVCFAMSATLILPPIADEPPREIHPWHYTPPNHIFFSNVDETSNTSAMYERSLTELPGLGTRCVAPDPLDEFRCQREDIEPNRTHLLYTPAEIEMGFSNQNSSPECSCPRGSQVCPVGAGGMDPPPHMLHYTTDMLMNMSRRNISDWIVKTTDYSTTHRYGGYTFGLKNPLTQVNISTLHENLLRLIRSLARNETEKDDWLNSTNTFIQRIDHLLTRLEVNENIKVWFNNKGWLSIPAYTNAINNLVLRTHLPHGFNQSNYGISVTSHPMNYTQDQFQEKVIRRSGVILLHAICVIFGMSFVPASFVLYLIEDRVTKSKHLQFVSGVRPFMYWITNLVWDNMNYAVSAFLCVLIFLAFQEHAYVSERNILPLILLLLLYGWASIPLMYPASYLFSVPSSAFVALGCLNLFIGIVTTTSTFIVEIMDDEELREIGVFLRHIFLVFPHYCMGRGLMDLATNQLRADAFKHFDIDTFQNPFEFLLKNLVAMIIQGFVGIILVILIQYRFCVRPRHHKVEDSEVVDEDEDVYRERQRVLAGKADSSVMRLENLTKVYSKGCCPSISPGCCSGLFLCSSQRNRHGRGGYRPCGSKTLVKAVDRICLGVDRGECFGLLGVNGAGKTTTFKMLTGDTEISKGNAFINGKSCVNQMNQVRQSIGYCPQFDALDGLLNVREHLELYARLRGIPEKYVKPMAMWGIKRLALTDYTTKWTRNLSGGNKRKLSTAIALMGDPSIIFLDEPTTGMDPKARRFLWTSIMDIVKEGRSVILTSHSMEECEALCTRLAVMVNGQFKCLGSIQHLKNRFGEGYILTVRTGGDQGAVEAVKASVLSSFAGSSLMEQHYKQLEFNIPAKGLVLAELFRTMEWLRQTHDIEDYSITQTTLDQVFINFARQPNDLVETEYCDEQLAAPPEIQI